MVNSGHVRINTSTAWVVGHQSGFGAYPPHGGFGQPAEPDSIYRYFFDTDFGGSAYTARNWRSGGSIGGNLFGE